MKLTWADYEAGLMALTIWREARGEPYLGKVAIAFAILNRVEKPSWWGHTIAAVIGKKFQFSSMSAPKDPQLILYPAQPDLRFEECMKAVTQVLNDEVANPVPHADSYYAVSISPPKFATQDCFVAQIGAHKFYNVDHDYEAKITGHGMVP